MKTPDPAVTLARMLGSTGMAHLVVPGGYDALIPAWLPGTPRAWTYASGVAELAVGGLVAWPRSRRLGATAAAALFLAVFPGNVKMALDWRDRGRLARSVAIGRLPLQVPLLAWALAVRRASTATPD